MVEAGIVLHDYHRRRLNPDGDEQVDRDFARFAREAEPGVWAVTVDVGGRWRAEPRGPTRLYEGMPTRLAVSPLAGGAGPIAKPASPSPYDAVRAEGVATLLTSADGAEIHEACVAAVVGWDGTRLVLAPRDRPRVWSTAEAAIREHLGFMEAPLLPGDGRPILLVNAVKGTCAVGWPGREPFPAAARETIDRTLRNLTRGRD